MSHNPYATLVYLFVFFLGSVLAVNFVVAGLAIILRRSYKRSSERS